MAEAVAVLGAAASVVSIIDVLARCIGTVRDLRDQWNDADLIVHNLVTQLVAFKAALTKIKEWSDSDSAEKHHQLKMDLDDSVTWCRTLAGLVNTLLSDLQQGPAGTLDRIAKARLLFGSKSMEDLQKMIDRQTNALNLLLNACNFKTLSEQKTFLERSSSRKTLKSVADDSASLIVHRDSSSLFSRYTDNESRMSMIFNFDGEVFGSKAYERAFRGALKTVIRRGQIYPTRRSGDNKLTKLQNEKNEMIERVLHQDRRRQEREVRVLLFGPDNNSKSHFFRMIRMIKAGGFSEAERKHWRVVIFNNLVNAFQTIIASMQETNTPFRDNESIRYAEYIATDPDIASDEPLPEAAHHAFTSLWADKGVQSEVSLLKASEYEPYDNLFYYVDQIDRLFAKGYLPTDQDILRTKVHTTGISETVFDLGNRTYRMVDTGKQRNAWKKWIHHFDNVQVLLFFVSMASYDQVPVEDRNGNQMHDALMDFESLVNLKYFEKSVVILFFTKIDLFREKLSTGKAPIDELFPDYYGGPTDVIAAKEFFATKFKQLNRKSDRKCYVHFVDAIDSDLLEKAVTSVENAVIRRNLNALKPWN